MAVDSVMATRMARLLALAHIAVGFLLICFGSADRVLRQSVVCDVGFGIWIGVWMCTTGGLGIPGSSTDVTRFRNVFAGVFMGFSITSAVFGGIIIFFYSVSIVAGGGRGMAVTVIILLLGIAEFGIGIWAAVCGCLMTPCCLCCKVDSQAELYSDNTTGYSTIPDAGGYSVATPEQISGSMVALSNAQADELPIGRVPALGEVQSHPAMVQASATTEMPATVSFP